MIDAPLIKYREAQKHSSTGESISSGHVYKKSKQGEYIVLMMSSTELFGFDVGRHKILSYLSHHNLSSQAMSNAINVMKSASESGVNPKVVQTLDEGGGGIFVDFVKGSNYFAFELYNDGEIIFTKKSAGSQSQINELNQGAITHNVFNS
jgi:hypothetical protein